MGTDVPVDIQPVDLPRRNVGERPPLVSNTAETAFFLRCSEPLVREYIREGRLRAVKIGRSYRITRDAIEALLAGRYAAP